MSTEIFHMGKAYELRLTYRKQRQYAKENLISQLIMYYNTVDLYKNLIVGKVIPIVGYYRKRTVEAVCNDLGYELISFSHSTINEMYGMNYGKYTNIAFKSAEA